MHWSIENYSDVALEMDVTCIRGPIQDLDTFICHSVSCIRILVYQLQQIPSMTSLQHQYSKKLGLPTYFRISGNCDPPTHFLANFQNLQVVRLLIVNDIQIRVLCMRSHYPKALASLKEVIMSQVIHRVLIQLLERLVNNCVRYSTASLQM